MPLDYSKNVLNAIKEIETGNEQSSYEVILLKILHCNGHVKKSFSSADCWTIQKFNYDRIVEKYGNGEQGFVVTLEHKEMYARYLKGIKSRINAKIRAGKPIPNTPEYTLPPVPSVNGFSTLFDLKLVKRLSTGMNENETESLTGDLLKSWSKETAQKKAVDLLHKFVKEVKTRKKVGNAHPLLMLIADALEPEWCKVAAVHLLEPLSNAPIYLESHYSKGDDEKCPCPCRKKVTFGDISIGNKEVWHGSPDMLAGHVGVVFESQPLAKFSFDKETKQHYTSTWELKKPKKTDDETKEMVVSETARSQTLSQSITFGCCKREREPSLVPHILMTGRFIQIFMYDANHDILLETGILPLMNSTNDEFDLNTILILWLALHWTLFSTGITNHIHDANFKSGFLHLMEKEKKLDKYMNENYVTQVSRNTDVSGILDQHEEFERVDESDVQPYLKRKASSNGEQDNKRPKDTYNFGQD